MKNLKMDFCQNFLVLFLDKKKIRSYLLGDPAYSLTPYCLKEYQSCSANDELLFHTMLRGYSKSTFVKGRGRH